MHSGVVPSGRVIAEARARMAELDACLRRDEGTSAQGLVGDIDSAGHEDAANSAYSKAA
jgi:hypothetical protein